MTLKEEGAHWGNLGLVPLKDVAGGKNKTTLPEKLFEYIYENLNQFYDFKALRHAKEKFAPSCWVPRYIVYNPNVSTLPRPMPLSGFRIPGAYWITQGLFRGKILQGALQVMSFQMLRKARRLLKKEE